MTIAIASGKGGTGKTTFAVNLAATLAGEVGTDAIPSVQLLDCDVEEPNDHLFLHPEFTRRISLTVRRPLVSADLCTGCGACADACRFNAIAVAGGKPIIFDDLCHACGVCSKVCPTGAITEHDVEVGQVQIAAVHGLELVQGTVNIGQAVSPVVIGAVKRHIDSDALTLIDAPPGTTCPVVKAVEGTDVAVLVTEPTPFGLHDLKLAVGLTARLNVPVAIVINQSGDADALITDYAQEAGIPVIGRIPFSRDYARAYSRGELLVDAFPELRARMLGIFARISEATVAAVAVETPGDSRTPTAAANTPGVAPTPAAAQTPAPPEVVVVSGKGGTGKTTVTAALADLAENAVLADTDVDAPDLHLLFSPRVQERHEFSGGSVAEIAPDLCTGCGLCARECRFDAIAVDNAAGKTVYKVDPVSCEGCGMCEVVCPAGAVSLNEHLNGHWFVSSTRRGSMVHALLGIAEENSGKLVTVVRNRAAELSDGARNRLTDGPPGTGCPVTASITGADLVLIVTEPTVSGVHDLDRVLQLTRHFNVPSLVVINKADLNDEKAHAIERMAQQSGSRVIGRIPYDREIRVALAAGRTIVQHNKGPATAAVRRVWKDLCAAVQDL